MGGADEVLELMLEYPKVEQKIDSKDCQQRTPLHYAAAMGYVNIVRRLLAHGAKLDPQDDKGATPLLLAVQFEWAEAAQALIDTGANPMIEDHSGHNAVDSAFSKEGPIVDVLSGFAGQRRQRTLLQSLRHLVTPGKKLNRVPHLKHEDEQRPDGPTAPLFYDDIVGEHVPPVEVDGTAAPAAGSPAGRPEQLSSALEEAVGAVARQSQADDAGIELDVEEPRVEAQARRSTTHSCVFDEKVKKLGFEVEWLNGCTAVGSVKPGGNAAQRGLVQGDRILEIAQVSTAGKGRDALLPLLKRRPLTLKVEHTIGVSD